MTDVLIVAATFCLTDRLTALLLRHMSLQAEMVFTTLSSSARDVFSRLVTPFELVLVDEAAQAAEIAALQPLVYGAK